MKASSLIQKHSSRNPYTIARLEDVPKYFQRYIVGHLLYAAVNNMVDVEELKDLGSYTELMKKYGMNDDIHNLSARLQQVLKSNDGIETLLDVVINDFRKDV